MSRKLEPELTVEMMELMPGGRACAVATVDAGGRPYLSLMAGVVAVEPSVIHLGCWAAGATLANIGRAGVVTIETLGPRAISIQCDARILKDVMDTSMFPPHPYALVEARVVSVKDDAPPTLKMSPLAFDYGAKQDAMELLERDFMAEMTEL